MKLFAKNNSLKNPTRKRFVSAGVCALLVIVSPCLWAGGRKAKIETSTASGGEIWQHEYDISERETGKYNIIVTAKDRAGNEAVSGPFDLRIDPNAGLPSARVVYPDSGAIIRQDLKLIGVASGRFGVARVTARLDDGQPRLVEGTEYWSLSIDSGELSDGKHTLYTQAFDSKGVPGPELSVDFIVDKEPPALELLTHNVGDLVSGNINVRGSADDPNGIRSVSLSEGDSVDFRPLSLKTKRGVSGVEFSFPVRTKNMDDGPIVYHLRAVDNTGYVTVKPYLFFVDNHEPELTIFTPEADENVYGKFMVSGSIHDIVGLERFYYEWGGALVDIPIRPGDPFWSVDLEITPDLRNTGRIKVTAVDKSGNATSVTRKLEDKRKAKQPVLVIDYPPHEVLGAMPYDLGIFGHIDSGFEGAAVVVENTGEEFPARPSFHIPNNVIAQGRSSLRLIPRAADGTTGAPVTIRINKPVPVAAEDGTLPKTEFYLSPLTISSPEEYSWFNTPAITLEGQVSAEAGQSRLEYRFNPSDEWTELPLDDGNFSAAVSTENLDEGFVHLELRTVRGGEADIPVYHPLNKAVSAPEISFIAPGAESGAIHGNVTIIGEINAPIPLKEISYSLDGNEFLPLPVTSKFGKTWFNYFCNFNDLNSSGSSFTVRVTDVSGAVFDKSLSVVFNADNDAPSLILNAPENNEVFAADFGISGVAFDDDKVDAVYWRVMGPLLESIPPGQASDAARAAAEAFAAAAEPQFNRLETEQNFEITVPFDTFTDGEYDIEVYVEDIYGVKNEVTSRRVRISTNAPETEVISPQITEYNHKTIQIIGKSTDANGIAHVHLSMDNGSSYQQTQSDQNDEWSLNLNTTSYKDGVYSALIRVEDNYGIISFSTAMINIDNTPPELSVNEPENGARVGNELRIMGRAQDNVHLNSVNFQIISASDSGDHRSYELPAEQIILQSIDMSGLPQGEYIVRGLAADIAGNESVFSQKIIYALDDSSSEIAIFNPMPGEAAAGPLNISGIVTGAIIPEEITLFLDESPAASVSVDRYGVFHYDIPETELEQDRIMTISASYDTPTGVTISSPRHQVRYAHYGPSLTIESHEDGDMITGRPYLSGRAWIGLPEPAEGEKGMSRRERAGYAVRQVLISYDNGRSFEKASGGAEWKFRMETGDLPVGPLPVLVRAEFANGSHTIRRVLLTVDPNAPSVALIAPPENSTHRDTLLSYGTAGDDFELDSVEISLRPGDKAGYTVPLFIQGLYLDTNFFGATYADFGMGLSFFKDNVRLQFQVGSAPADGSSDSGRFTGTVVGGKIIANVFYLPFDYFFGPDWSFYSMSIALGANFSYFTMGEGRDPLFMGAVLAQWEFLNADMSYLVPKWKIFKKIAFYLEPVLWFVSSDVNASTIYRTTIGARINIF